MGKVKNNINGALAPSSPDFCNESNFLETTEEMIKWYYTTPDTLSVSVYDIGRDSMVVEIVTIIGDYLKVRTETIGRSKKSLIRKKYLFDMFGCYIE